MSSKKPSTPRKVCQDCNKSKAQTYFYKVDSPLFPDGTINTCRDCIRKNIDINDIEQVIGFLRQIDKPFYQEEWSKAMEGKNHPIGSYMQKINGLTQYKGKTFTDSDGVSSTGTVDLSSVNAPDLLHSVNGDKIEYSDDLVNKWGIGYSRLEYLQLEKYFIDMMLTHEVYTATHIDILTQMAYLSVDRDKLRQKKDWLNYEKVSNAYAKMMQVSGFTPKDRKTGDEATGLGSFSQVWAEVEKEGLVLPKMMEYEKDDIDHMLLYYVQFAQRMTGKSVSTQTNPNWREELIDEDTEVLIEEEINND